MKLIIGLGNPEAQYAATKHNLGSMVIQLLAQSNSPAAPVWEKWQNKALITTLHIGQHEVKLAKSLTFMNESGTAVSKLVNFYKVPANNLWVVHDELDLPFGVIRLSWQSSSAGHRGIENIIEELGTTDFWRFRLGIGRPQPGIPVDQYVLAPFNEQEKDALPFFLSKAVTRLKLALEEGAQLTMHKYNE
jgi:peptidyl-tRNA hydrolase, PTH1 family